MILGVDASNLSRGGGITHLTEVLRAAEPGAAGFTRVVLWAARRTLAAVGDQPWLDKQGHPWLERGLAWRTAWQLLVLPRLARRAGCAVLYVPGGASACRFRPSVTMSRNLLPFEWREMARFGLRWPLLKCLILRRTQAAGLRRADGVMFLTRYAQEVVTRVTGPLRHAVIVPHGIDDRFVIAPRPARALQDCSAQDPLRLVYVSIIDVYKHQWHVAEAVARLRAEGLPLRLELVGPSYGPALARLERILRRVDPDAQAVRYLGAVPFEQLHELYRKAEVCVFASSCENLPNILIEGMASGLPIACSDRGPMPEVLGDAGITFDPESVDSIAAALRTLCLSTTLRLELAERASARAAEYSWQRCARDTFGFLAQVARRAGPV